MEKKELLKIARPETRPKLPGKIRWKAKFFGNQKVLDYIWNYYERESEYRVPFYLPYIYMKECLAYLRRYTKIPKKQMNIVLIDDGDYRTDYFLNEFLEEFNYLTIVTDRKEYFEGLQERAFQELGLLIDLMIPWEEKNLRGNIVWDFTEAIQKSDCYPDRSICFVPHKKEWKIKDLLQNGQEIIAVSLKCVEISNESISPALAESLLVPWGVTFRKSRCEDLNRWCKMKNLKLKLKAETLEKP